MGYFLDELKRVSVMGGVGARSYKEKEWDIKRCKSLDNLSEYITLEIMAYRKTEEFRQLLNSFAYVGDITDKEYLSTIYVPVNIGVPVDNKLYHEGFRGASFSLSIDKLMTLRKCNALSSNEDTEGKAIIYIDLSVVKTDNCWSDIFYSAYEFCIVSDDYSENRYPKVDLANVGSSTMNLSGHAFQLITKMHPSDFSDFLYSLHYQSLILCGCRRDSNEILHLLISKGCLLNNTSITLKCGKQNGIFSLSDDEFYRLITAILELQKKYKLRFYFDIGTRYSYSHRYGIWIAWCSIEVFLTRVYILYSIEDTGQMDEFDYFNNLCAKGCRTCGSLIINRTGEEYSNLNTYEREWVEELTGLKEKAKVEAFTYLQKGGHMKQMLKIGRGYPIYFGE